MLLNPPIRDVWMRRCTSSNHYAPRQEHPISLAQLGVAAARETFVTATIPFAAAWTNLFLRMITRSQMLQWREDGPGVGRDARIAYSGLLGRYVARAYLTQNEGVRVLVPLDRAKRCFKGEPYSICKRSSGHGLEADWVGLDDQRRLVIVEAKGTFNEAVQRWKGPSSVPPVLLTAIEQSRRTVIARDSKNGFLTSKRWAIASRWANEQNKRDPTVIAWNEDDGMLDNSDYRSIAKLLHTADIEDVMTALGHHEALRTITHLERETRVLGETRLRVNRRDIEPGFVAFVGPVGIIPLYGRYDLDLEWVRRICELSPPVALVSLSSRYVRMILRGSFTFDEFEHYHPLEPAPETDERLARQGGLTVAWSIRAEEIEEIASVED